jgi:predicted type IV restriction endonuclease
LLTSILKDAGWDIFDRSQVFTDEPAADGRADYPLKSALTRPLCVIETEIGCQ